MNHFIEYFAKAVVGKPWLFILIAVALSVGAIPGILLLKTDSGFDTLISSDSAIFRATTEYERHFGGESIIVRLNGNLEEVLSSRNLRVLAEFEERYSGDSRIKTMLSPVTVLQIAAAQAKEAGASLRAQLAAARQSASVEARKTAAALGLGQQEQELAAQKAAAAVLAEFQPALDTLQAMGSPGLDNSLFVSSVLFTKDGFVNEQATSVIPDRQNALVIITPAGNLSDSALLQAANEIERYFSDNPLDNTATVVFSATKLMDAIAGRIASSLKLLLGLSVVVMVAVLYLTFRVRWRLLSLAIVGIGAVWAFGAMGYAGIPISIATMAVLPILIGLGIDYSIQFHNRYQEMIRQSASVKEAIAVASKSMAGAVALALVTTMLSFITLVLNKIPMIRDFGLVLSLGILMCYIAALFLVHSVVQIADRKIPLARLQHASLEASGRIEKALAWMTRVSLRIPLAILIISLLMAIGGFFADSRLEITTNYQEFIPQDISVLKEARELGAITGSDGMLTFMLQAPDVTEHSLLTWLKSFQESELAQHPDLISASSLLTLVEQGTGSDEIPDKNVVDAVLTRTPAAYKSRFVSDDKSAASISFRYQFESFDQVNYLIKSIQEEAGLPQGVSIAPVGTYAMAASLFESISGSRLWTNLICLGAIALVLLLAYRRLTSTVMVVITAGMVLLWSSADMFLFGIPLNPLTQVLGVIVIGSVTEYVVIILNRYRQEKALGESPAEAMTTAVSRVGRAVVASSVTTLGGFAVLIASDFIMLRDFGIATVIGIILCIISAMMVMPPLIVWLDERGRKSNTISGKK